MRLLLLSICILCCLAGWPQLKPNEQVVNMDSMIKAEMNKIEGEKTVVLGKPFPSFQLRSQNHILSNTTLKGKVVFVNFWFASCTPCILEFKALNQLYDKLRDEKDFRFLSITYEKEEVIDKVKAKFNIQYPIFSTTPAECQRLMQDLGYPTSYIISKEGLVKNLFSGGEPTEEEATTMVMATIYPAILKEL